MAAELQSTSEGLTMVLTISNPEHRNALGPEIYAAGVEALNAAESSAEVRSVVIAGEGAIFSAGGNLQRLQANRQQPREIQARSIEGLHNWIEAIRTFPKPVIAAVEGPAAGAGFSLALACDFIIAATNARRIRQRYMIAADIPRHPSFGRAPRRSTIRESIAATCACNSAICASRFSSSACIFKVGAALLAASRYSYAPVSYTHLTLPTNREV
mgnify:CR=1 FL=1